MSESKTELFDKGLKFLTAVLEACYIGLHERGSEASSETLQDRDKANKHDLDIA